MMVITSFKISMHGYGCYHYIPQINNPNNDYYYLAIKHVAQNFY